MANLTERVEAFARNNGADLIGVAPAGFFKAQDRKDKFCPHYYLPDAENVIVIGLKLVDAVWDRLQGKHDPYSINMHSYLMHYNYDQLDYLAVKVARYLEEEGYDGYPIEARTLTKSNKIFIGLFPFKEAAVIAGLGSIGKNTMLITPQFGPRVRLVTVITDAPLKATNLETQEDSLPEICHSCTLCLDKCPVQALHYCEEKGVTIEKEKCQAHMDWAQCALCQGICKAGREAARKRRSRRS